jgi:hypothetical protein
MRFFRLFLATLWLVALGFSAAPAHAATISVSPPRWANRVADRLINKFNRKDCIDGDGTAEGIADGAVATFSVSVVGAPTNALFQVWSGTGCDQYANRSPTAVSRTCTAITEALAPRNGDVPVHLRDMIAAYGATVDQSATECDASTTAGLQTRSLYFVVSDPTTNATLATGTGTPWAFTYDVKAPPPPTNVAAGSGDGSLVTSFTAPAGETNLLHYKFFCSQIGDAPVMAISAAGTGGTAGTSGTDTAGTDTGGVATGGAADTGTSGTSGTAGTTTTTEVDAECQSSILIPGQPPPAEGYVDCGEIAAQGATGGETNPVLTNDIKYVVAVATEDNVNNVGVLSKLACGVPKDTIGFGEAYGKAGGQAGGGFCTFAPATHGAWATLVALLVGACALVRRRK